jgi:hypothetical protein
MTLALAIYAAVVATLGVGWQVYTWLHGRQAHVAWNNKLVSIPPSVNAIPSEPIASILSHPPPHGNAGQDRPWQLFRLSLWTRSDSARRPRREGVGTQSRPIGSSPTRSRAVGGGIGGSHRRARGARLDPSRLLPWTGSGRRLNSEVSRPGVLILPSSHLWDAPSLGACLWGERNEGRPVADRPTMAVWVGEASLLVNPPRSVMVFERLHVGGSGC